MDKKDLIDFGKMAIEIGLNKIVALSGVTFSVKELRNNVMNHSVKSAVFFIAKMILTNMF